MGMSMAQQSIRPTGTIGSTSTVSTLLTTTPVTPMSVTIVSQGNQPTLSVSGGQTSQTQPVPSLQQPTAKQTPQQQLESALNQAQSRIPNSSSTSLPTSIAQLQQQKQEQQSQLQPQQNPMQVTSQAAALPGQPITKDQPSNAGSSQVKNESEIKLDTSQDSLKVELNPPTQPTVKVETTAIKSEPMDTVELKTEEPKMNPWKVE